MYHYCLSERYKNLLIHDGFVYSKVAPKSKTKNSWKCVVDGCAARVKFIRTSLSIEENDTEHIHQPNLEEKLIASKRRMEYRVKRIEMKTEKTIARRTFFRLMLDTINRKRFPIEVNNQVQPDGGLVNNSEFCDFVLNMEIASKLGIKFPDEVVGLFYIHGEKEFYEIYRFPNLTHKNPVHIICQNTINIYKNKHQNGQHVENLISGFDFRSDIDLVLRQIGVNNLVKQIIRHYYRRISPFFLSIIPYKRTCECGADCTNEPIHSISNFMIFRGDIGPIYHDHPDALKMLNNQEICPFGRFRNPQAFATHYFGKEIYIEEDIINGEYACDCQKILTRNGAHFLSNWMLKNGFVSEDDFQQFAVNRLVGKCEKNRFFTSIELRDFYVEKKDLFEECEEDALLDNELYFSFCARIRPDIQAGVTCRTKSRIIAGSFLYMGMEHRRHFRYKGNREVVDKMLRKFAKK